MRDITFEKPHLRIYWLIVPVVIVIWCMYCFNRFGNFILDQEFHGIIERVYVDSTRMHNQVIILENSNKPIIIENQEYFPQISVGDSILKIKNQYTVTLVKKTGEVIKFSKN